MLKFKKESKGKEALGIEDEVKHVRAKKSGRKMYETSADLQKEGLFAQELSNTFKVALDKLPISYGLDFLVTKNNDAIGVMEVKHRNNNHDTYPTVMLSLLKWNKGIDFAIKNKLIFSFAVRFQDGDYRYVWSENDEFQIEFGGRTKQTRDSADVEPVVLIPCAMFQKIPTKKL